MKNFMHIVPIILVVLIGCSVEATLQPTELLLATEDVEHANTSTLNSPVTPDATPIPTINETKEWVFPPNPTWTPWPELSKEQGSEEIHRLFETNGGCSIPCFWEIMPGSSTLEEVYQKFSRLGWVGFETKSRKRLPAMTLEMPMPPDIFPNEYARVYMETVDNQHVSYISVRSRYFSDYAYYDLSSFLNEFGTPSEVWIYSVYNEPATPWFQIRLVYESMGVEISSASITYVEKYSETEAAACANKTGIFYLTLWDPLDHQTIERLNEIREDARFELIEERSYVTAEWFYQTYKESSDSDECFWVFLD